MFYTIPTERPETPLLNAVDSPSDLRELTTGQLETLAEELRHFLLFSVGQTGGHFGAGLGVVELTIALHHCLNTPHDHLVWDVGHQTYPHKILTGRRERMHTLRQAGESPPSRCEKKAPTTRLASATPRHPLAQRLGWPSPNKRRETRPAR